MRNGVGSPNFARKTENRGDTRRDTRRNIPKSPTPSPRDGNAPAISPAKHPASTPATPFSMSDGAFVMIRYFATTVPPPVMSHRFCRKGLHLAYSSFRIPHFSFIILP